MNQSILCKVIHCCTIIFRSTVATTTVPSSNSQQYTTPTSFVQPSWSSIQPEYTAVPYSQAPNYSADQSNQASDYSTVLTSDGAEYSAVPISQATNYTNQVPEYAPYPMEQTQNYSTGFLYNTQPPIVSASLAPPLSSHIVQPPAVAYQQMPPVSIPLPFPDLSVPPPGFPVLPRQIPPQFSPSQPPPNFAVVTSTVPPVVSNAQSFSQHIVSQSSQQEEVRLQGLKQEQKQGDTNKPYELETEINVSKAVSRNLQQIRATLEHTTVDSSGEPQEKKDINHGGRKVESYQSANRSDAYHRHKEIGTDDYQRRKDFRTDDYQRQHGFRESDKRSYDDGGNRHLDNQSIENIEHDRAGYDPENPSFHRGEKRKYESDYDLERSERRVSLKRDVHHRRTHDLEEGERIVRLKSRSPSDRNRNRDRHSPVRHQSEDKDVQPESRLYDNAEPYESELDKEQLDMLLQKYNDREDEYGDFDNNEDNSMRSGRERKENIHLVIERDHESKNLKHEEPDNSLEKGDLRQELQRKELHRREERYAEGDDQYRGDVRQLIDNRRRDERNYRDDERTRSIGREVIEGEKPVVVKEREVRLAKKKEGFKAEYSHDYQHGRKQSSGSSSHSREALDRPEIPVSWLSCFNRHNTFTYTFC